MLSVMVNYAPLSSPKPNKARQWDYAYRPKSTTLGPPLILISNFLEKAPFLAPIALDNYRLEFEKVKNMIDNTSTNIRFVYYSRDFFENNVGFER